MRNNEQLREILSEDCPELLFADGYDEAIIGTTTYWNKISETIIAYDVEKILEILMSEDLTYDEAREFYEFNIVGAWMGEFTPIFIETNVIKLAKLIIAEECKDPMPAKRPVLSTFFV